MKSNADRVNNAKEFMIKVGDTVLVRKKKENKWSTRFDPQPYCVTRVKGTMITATRPGHYITRNISFFKKMPSRELPHNSNVEQEEAYEELEDNSLMETLNDETNSENELVDGRYPLRDRRPIDRYGHNVYD